MNAMIAICTYNRSEELMKTLSTIESFYNSRVPVIVVDQSIESDAAAAVKDAVDDKDYIHFVIQKEPSLTKARNKALKTASDAGIEIIIYIDDDVEILEGFIEEHISAFNDENIVAVGGKEILLWKNPGWKERLNRLLYPLVSLGYKKNRYGENRYAPGLVLGKTFFAGGFYQVDYPCYLDTVKGCNMSFRVSALQAIGGFDENFQGSARREESDVSFRILQKFGRCSIMFQPKAALIHHMASSGGCRISSRRRDDYRSNEFYFIDKHIHNPLARGLAKLYTRVKLIFLD